MIHGQSIEVPHAPVGIGAGVWDCAQLVYPVGFGNHSSKDLHTLAELLWYRLSWRNSASDREDLMK